jgi:hypothetical protein
MITAGIKCILICSRNMFVKNVSAVIRNSICQLILLCPSKFNLKNNNIISGYIFDMFIESDRFDCYMTSQTDNAATSSLYGTTSNVLLTNKCLLSKFSQTSRKFREPSSPFGRFSDKWHRSTIVYNLLSIFVLRNSCYVQTSLIRVWIPNTVVFVVWNNFFKDAKEDGRRRQRPAAEIRYIGPALKVPLKLLLSSSSSVATLPPHVNNTWIVSIMCPHTKT